MHTHSRACGNTVCIMSVWFKGAMCKMFDVIPRLTLWVGGWGRAPSKASVFDDLGVGLMLLLQICVHSAENKFFTSLKTKAIISKLIAFIAPQSSSSTTLLSPSLNVVRLLMLNFHWFLVVFAQFLLLMQKLIRIHYVINMEAEKVRNAAVTWSDVWI